MSKARQIKLGMFLRPAAHHIAGWRHEDAWADGGLNFATFVEMAHKAEAGLFDMMFSADVLTGERYDREYAVAYVLRGMDRSDVAPHRARAGDEEHRARLHGDHHL